MTARWPAVPSGPPRCACCERRNSQLGAAAAEKDFNAPDVLEILRQNVRAGNRNPVVFVQRGNEGYNVKRIQHSISDEIGGGGKIELGAYFFKNFGGRLHVAMAALVMT